MIKKMTASRAAAYAAILTEDICASDIIEFSFNGDEYVTPDRYSAVNSADFERRDDDENPPAFMARILNNLDPTTGVTLRRFEYGDRSNAW